MDIQGKVAVVTGGASGIGQAVARGVVAKGGKAIIFDLNEEAGAAMVDELGADNCVFAMVNVVDEDSVKAGLAKGVAAFGTVHINVNCENDPPVADEMSTKPGASEANNLR